MFNLQVLINAITIILSIVAGAWLEARFGFFHDRQSRREEKGEEKNEAIQTLFNEINHNDGFLNKGFEERTKYRHKAFWHSLRTAGFKSVFSSERYQLFSPDDQDKLSEYYEKVKRMNTLVNRLDGEERGREIQKIRGEQTPLLKDLRSMSSKLRARAHTPVSVL